MTVFDHALLLAGDAHELERFRQHVAPAGDCTAVVMHEADGSCCRQEAWAQTALRLTLAALPAPADDLQITNSWFGRARP